MLAPYIRLFVAASHLLTPTLAQKSSFGASDVQSLATSTRNPSSADRLAWCSSQRTLCSTLCGGSAPKNTCNSDTLDFTCNCASNNSQPALQYYSGSLVSFECGALLGKCLAAHANDLASQDQCMKTYVCGKASDDDAQKAGSAAASAAANSASSALSGSSSGSSSAPASQATVIVVSTPSAVSTTLPLSTGQTSSLPVAGGSQAASSSGSGSVASSSIVAQMSSSGNPAPPSSTGNAAAGTASDGGTAVQTDSGSVRTVVATPTTGAGSNIGFDISIGVGAGLGMPVLLGWIFAAY